LEIGEKMKLGINSYTFMWSIGFQGANPAYPDKGAWPQSPLTPIGLLEKALDLGVKVVQTGPNLRLEALSEVEMEAFIQAASSMGIELELGTRGLDYDHLVRQVALAKRMGAALIRTLPEIEGQYVAQGRLIPPAVRQILPLLEREGIKLGIENGKTPAAELSAALDEVGSPLVGVVLDMVNSLAVPEGWKEVTLRLAPYTLCVHYKDFTLKRAWHMMGFICEGMPAGKGMVDTDWLLAALRASPYDFNVMIELWPPEQETLEQTVALEQAWAVESVPYLRRYIKD
jgi:sugar phosphate isomerase/epimerase